MVLKLETYTNPETGWITIDTIRPNDPPGSISDNVSSSYRDVYVFACEPDDSKSVLYRSNGVDYEVGPNRILDKSHLQVFKRLLKGESHEMSVHPDKALSLRKIRFTHI